MAIDISHVEDEEQLLPRLGEGDWVIATADGYPELIVPQAWRDERIAETARRFVRWVVAGKHIEIAHDDDPRWDDSGEAHTSTCDIDEMLAFYPTLEAWLIEEYNGQWEATYESGHGRNWQTLNEEVTSAIDSQFSDLIRTQWAAHFDFEATEAWDAIWDDLAMILFNLQYALRLLVGKLTTETAWRDFKAVTYAYMRHERKQAALQAALQAAEHARLSQMTAQFWQQHFAEWDRVYVDRPHFRAALRKRLTEALADADPEMVEAICQVGLPGHFSNRVKSDIHEMAKHALENEDAVM